MNRKVEIKRNDFSRVVLTDVHPYELPFIITNEGFHKKLYENDLEVINTIFEHEKIFKPFEFKITKDASSFRNLSLIHPFSQIEISDFYKKYKDLILYYCSLSRLSIRYPSNISLYYISYNDNITCPPAFIDESIDLESEDDGTIEENKSIAYASSFFSYKSYSFLYKFYDSYEMNRLERKFKVLCKQDISKCFESITLDSMQCLIRGEYTTRILSAKQNSFEVKFTELMSKTNFGRSSGVLIGPEFSRIFSEIILQQIDITIIEKLKEKKFSIEKDYAIRRYVDDYFIFTNDEVSLRVIENIIKAELYHIKLFLNESKKEVFKRPFVTGVTKAKIHIRELFNPIINSIDIGENNELKLYRNFSEYNFKNISNDIISKIKLIVSDNNIGYESITGYFFSVIRSLFRRISSLIMPFESCGNSDQVARFIFIIIDISFFIYSMDKRVRATFLISQSLIEFSKFNKKLSYYSECLITNKIISESKRIAAERDKETAGIEQINLAIALSELNSADKISNIDMENLIGYSTNDSLNYFQIVVSLFVSKNIKDYMNIKKKAITRSISLLKNYEIDTIDSQKTHLLLDLMTCPYINRRKKLAILENAFPSLDKKTINIYFKQLSLGSWFVDWSSISIERLLMKKELRIAY